MNFKKINSITGWVVFAIASITYLLTIEPTASFWDCGEFITTAFRLEVGHPPGAPLFMLIARICTLFAGDNVELVAKMINSFSALCSGFTILLLFWTVTHLGRKITGKGIAELTSTQTIAIIGSGVVGALAYTFSDTFWFSAVEGEVYAFSSLFTALVFWAILRWEDEADSRFATRWLVLIAYLMGLSIGVHLLNLLAIPAIGLVIYHRKYPVTLKGTLLALAISAVVLLVILYGIVPGVIQIAVVFELLFVKSMGLPMNTGVIIYAALLIGGIIFGLYYSLQKKKLILNHALLFVSVIIIGYSSYAALIIRSSVEPPMDQNNPQNLFNLQYYLNREQYGDRPLVTGPYYNSPPVDVKEGKTLYAKRDNQYVEIGKKQDYIYADNTTTIFPRMYSRESQHVSAYKEWGKVKGHPVKIRLGDKQDKVQLPTFGENLHFFFSYQLGWMYFRYFLWNFAGRQDDIQGHGGPLHGNWISGFTSLDESRLGPQDLPETLHNKGRNNYFFLPLLLGLIGLAFQFQRDRNNFLVTLTLFIMTGVAIVVYLNQTPYQPRERDYAYAGSFYAFAIWIGLGVMAVIHALSEKMRTPTAAIAISVALLAVVPVLMAQQNWDDHDRSGRYTARDFAHNYLASCDDNAIIFTNGDNDTFPLWYAQEVEGMGSNTRVVNLSYLAADWYIDQMTRKAYDSDVLPFSLKPEQYMSGTRDVLYISDLFNGQYMELKEVMDFVRNDDVRTKGVTAAEGFLWSGQLGKEIKNVMTEQLSDFIPAKNLKITVDKQKVLNNGTVALKDSALIVPEVQWTLKGEKSGKTERLYKNSMMVLDILANNNWERPVYFAITVSADNYLNLSDYFQMDGLAYRFVPIKTPSREYGETGRIDPDKLYDKMMNQFRWGNISDSTVYLDETNLRLLSHFRSNFARLAGELTLEGKKDSALRVLDRAFEVIPTYQLPLHYTDVIFVEQYYAAGAFEKGNQLAKSLFDIATEELRYYHSFPKALQRSSDIAQIVKYTEYTVTILPRLATGYKQTELAEELTKKINESFPQEIEVGD
ncbi:MAG: DUF2723 domain-containing protein [Bacteroidales bacterium]|jgi:tetratricopeptide (TPR) repeat protein|nr:DUF2723 domain-containing protein [Bacteroidales bacterium]